jgi:thioester reductase-like protein
MGTLFFTGFPGFLGAELLPRLLARCPGQRAACLVQSKYADVARRRLREIETAHPELAGRIDIVEGDITQPRLGLTAADALRSGVVEIYHLAAVYDLGVGRDLAMRVNVEGTRRMLEFACECPALERFQYVSTCYVSGKYAGVFSEEDLDHGQAFHNFYEETKFLAEVEVQKCMREGLPATIYRPAVVVGDSATGATQKYDGPYCIIRVLLRQPKVAILPTIMDDPTRTEVNLVPRDFVIDAITYLSGASESRNQVYQLSDPNPLTVEKLIDVLARATRRRVVRVPVPLGAAKLLLTHVPGVSRMMGIPPDTLDYFVHPARYATARTQAALEAGGIRCPRFDEYVDRLVAFVRAHPEIGSAAMV